MYKSSNVSVNVSDWEATFLVNFVLTVSAKSTSFLENY